MAGLWSWLKGAKDAALDPGKVFQGLRDGIDSLHYSDEEKNLFRVQLEELERARTADAVAAASASDARQTEVNLAEIQRRGRFDSWRSMLGFVLVLCYAWHYIIHDIISWLSINVGMAPPPTIEDFGELSSVVYAMLGIGVMKTAERWQAAKLAKK